MTTTTSPPLSSKKKVKRTLAKVAQYNKNRRDKYSRLKREAAELKSEEAETLAKAIVQYEARKESFRHYNRKRKGRKSQLKQQQSGEHQHTEQQPAEHPHFDMINNQATNNKERPAEESHMTLGKFSLSFVVN